jgi:hypothetical protein
MAAASIAAFAVAGALTGAVSATALTATNDRAADDVDPVSIADLASFVNDDTALFGAPVVLSGHGDASSSLGIAPAGATQIALALRCGGPGTFEVLVDEERALRVTCDEESSPRAGGGAYFLLDEDDAAATHALTISTAAENGYLLWASWAAQAPVPAPSPAQASAVSDGVVGAEEYAAQFDAFAQCMQAAGHPLGSVNRNAPVFTYAVDARAVESGDDARCYAVEFAEADALWQQAHAGG